MTDTPSGMDELVIDPREPMRVRADMARAGLAPSQMYPYEDPERGWLDPLDDDEMRTVVRRFLSALWRGCLAAEGQADD